jgi:hypothetical protein
MAVYIQIPMEALQVLYIISFLYWLNHFFLSIPFVVNNFFPSISNLDSFVHLGNPPQSIHHGNQLSFISSSNPVIAGK